MVKRVCVVWLMLVSVAFAGTSWIELLPDRPGPYEPGVSVDVDVVFHSMEDETIALRLLTLDFSATDSQLSLPRTFEFTLVPPLLGDYLYSFFEEMPKVDAIYTSANGPGYLLYLSHGYALTMGTISVGLPVEEGAYVLDAMNREAPDLNRGARFDYGFDERLTLHWLNGNLAGGQLAMTVVPEPGTTVLMMVGGFGVAVFRRRRATTEQYVCPQSP